MTVQAALNGNRSDAIVPATVADLVASAAACIRSGATSIHLHPRDAAGRESLDGRWIDATVAALREAVPGVPVGVSTGAWIEPDLPTQLARIRSWTELPDFASVNFDEPGCREVAALLTEWGIPIEAGLSDETSAKNFAATARTLNILRILIEPQAGQVAAALATVAGIESILEGADLRYPRLLHGVDITAWPMVEAAGERAYATRMGFEDTLLLPDGRPARSNAELLTACLAWWQQRRPGPARQVK